MTRRALAVEIRAAELAARYFADGTLPDDGQHFGVSMGIGIHSEWSYGSYCEYGHRQWLTTEHREVGYLARQIICGDGGR